MQGYETRAFRGLGVFVSMPARRASRPRAAPTALPLRSRSAPSSRAQYEVSDDQDSVQMLQRSSQVGEFYRMMPPAVWNKNKLLPSQYLDLLIYDEEADQLKHIDFEQALFATGAGGPGLDPAQLLGDDFGQQRTAAGAADFEANGASAAQAAEAATALGLLLAAGGKTVPNIVRCVKAGVWLPVCITIVRPFIEHLMMSTVCTVSGRDTGATLFGPADMQISANTSVKTIEGHYTCHTKSVITKPQNVYVMRDVMCSGYVAGGNCRFFGMPAGAGKFDGPADRGNIQRSLNERLSFADDASGEYASMLAFLSPYSDEVNSSRDQIISISDRLLPWEVSKNADPAKKYFPGGQTGYNTYAQQWNLGQIHFGEDVRATENMAFMSQGAVNNSLCVLGPHRRYNPFVTLHVTREPSTFGYRGKCWLCPSRLLPAWLAASASAQWYRLRHLLHLRRRTSSSWCPARATLARTRSRATRGGGAESRSRSRPRATRWSRSRWRRTRSSRCASRTASKRAAACPPRPTPRTARNAPLRALHSDTWTAASAYPSEVCGACVAQQ